MKIPMKNGSLSLKLFRRLIVILLIGQAATIALIYTERLRVEEREVTKRVELFGRIIASSSYRALLDSDFTYLTLLISDILKDEDVLSVVVKDSKGQEYTYNGDTPKQHRQSALIQSPITSRDGTVGEVRISCTFDNIRNRVLTHLAKLVVLQGVILLILLLFVDYFFRKYIGKNLSMITRLLQGVREGDLTARTGYRGDSREIVMIAEGLDFLVEHLAATIRKMNHISENLRQAVERTRQVMDRVSDDARKQQRNMDTSFQALNEASLSQSQIIDHTTALQNMTQANSNALMLMKGTFEGTVTTIDSLDTSTATLHSTINELSHSSSGVAGLAEQAAESVNEVSTAMAALNSLVANVSDVVRKSKAMSEDATERISGKGVEAVGNAIDTTRRIESFFNSLSETIVRLDARSKDIAGILNVIHDVTDQVNLLSLNALIIAGQSGESGGSFGVVAREMKLLATKVSRSAKEIEAIIKAIHEEIDAAVLEREETAQAVQEGKSVAALTGDVIDEILELSTLSTGMTQEIAAMTHEQNRLIESVDRDVTRLRELNQKVKSATGEEEVSISYIMEAASRISHSMGETRRETEEQFRTLKLIAANTGEADSQLEDIVVQSMRQQSVNSDTISSLGGNLAMAEAMVAGIEKVSTDISDVFQELERLREEVAFFRTGENGAIKGIGDRDQAEDPGLEVTLAQ